MRFDLIGGSYQSTSPVADAETLVNFYPEKIEANGKSAMALYPRPGLSIFTVLPDSPVRAQKELNGRHFAVGGTKFCEIASDGTVTVRGTVANDGRPVSIAASATQLLIVSAGSAYFFTLGSNAFGPIPALAAPPSYAIEPSPLGLFTVQQAFVGNCILTASAGIITITFPASPWPYLAPGDIVRVSAAGPSFTAGDYPLSTINGNTASYVGVGSGTVAFATVTSYRVEVAAAGVTTFPFSTGETVVIAGASDPVFNRSYIVANGGPDAGSLDLHVTSASIIGHTGSGGGTLSAPSVQSPAQCDYCRGFFVVRLKDSQRWQISSPLDATTWDGTDTSLLSDIPDNIVSMLVDHNEVIFWGRKRAIIYAVSANLFPFDPVPGGVIEQGCCAEFSPCRVDNSVFWLGRDELGTTMAWRLNGYLPARVSTHALENIWAGLPTVEDAVSMAYQWKGHTFWQIYFPTANMTWVYDTATGIWHRDGYWAANGL